MAGMGDAFPRRGLGGSAENWGRHLEQRIVGLESLIRQLTGGAANISRQIEGNTANVSGQITTLSGVVTDLGNQQTTLSGVVTDLGNQQTTLSGVVTDLGNTVNQINGSRYANVSETFTLNKPSTPGAWSDWKYTASLGPFYSHTNRVLIFGAINASADVLNYYLIVGRFGLASGTEGAGDTSPTGATWLSTNEASVAGASDERMNVRSTAMGVIEVPKGAYLTMRCAFQARDYGDGPAVPSSTPSVNQITMYAMPV